MPSKSTVQAGLGLDVELGGNVRTQLDAGQLARRQNAADRHDDALRRFPSRQGEEFTQAIQEVVGELGMLIAEMPPDTTSSVEWARTLRWLADAYFDLARGQDAKWLERGCAIYRRADALLGNADPVERAKLLTNWANTLRGLADTEQRDLAEEALERYRTARALFAQHDPSHVAVVDDLIGSLEPMLALMATRDELAHAGPPTRDIALEKVEEFRSRLDSAATRIPLEVNKALRASQRLAKDAGVDLDVTEIEQLVAVAKTNRTDPATGDILDALVDRLERDIQEGKVSPDRAQALRSLLADLSGAVNGANDIDALTQRRGRLEDLFDRLAPLVNEPSHGLPKPPPGSRAARVQQLWASVRNATQLLATNNAGEQTKAAAFGLVEQTAKLDREIYIAGADDDKTTRLEREQLRPVAVEARRLALIRNLTLAAPDFDGGKVRVAGYAVFHAGDRFTRALTERACADIGLQLQDEALGEDAARTRWRQLREASVGVFDFTPKSSARERAAVGYEFGLARAVGLPVVVLKGDEPLPFDVAVKPLTLNRRDEDVGRLSAALDKASYGVPAEAVDHTGIASTVREMQSRYGAADEHAGVPMLLRELCAALDDPDPKAIADKLRAVLLQIGNERLELLTPAWPASYPNPGRARLFHATPYRPKWANETCEAIRRCCADKVSYVLHKEVGDERIIVSMWKEISNASHVLADITGMNANVAVEIGFAHALGKPTLMVAQADNNIDSELFDTIARRHVHGYQLDDLATLTNAVARFVRIQPAPTELAST